MIDSRIDDFEIELAPCSVCNSLPVLRRKRGSTYFCYYYECNGDCWTKTCTHGCKDDAAKEWNAIQYNQRLQGVAETHYDRDTALAIFKEFARDMYPARDIFGDKELRINTHKFEAIRKKYLG